MNPKAFRVAAISTNTNSFGLRGHILMNRDGVTYQVGRSDYNGEDRWKVGQIIMAEGQFRFPGTEIPHRMETPPVGVIEKVWGEYSVNLVDI
jgi:hypothetical protein